MTLPTLNTIVTDLLLIARGSKLAASEKISKRQIEAWVHQYRSLLIRQNISGGDNVNPDYVQTISSIELLPVDIAGSSTSVSTDSNIYRTSSKLPKTVNLRNMSGITYVGTLNKKRIQLVPGHRVEYQLFKKFTPKDMLAYLEDGYLYVVNPYGVRYVTIRGIFENPVEAALYSNTTMSPEDFDTNSQYPIPTHMLPALKQLILERELGIESVTPSDNKNDSQHKINNE